MFNLFKVLHFPQNLILRKVLPVSPNCLSPSPWLLPLISGHHHLSPGLLQQFLNGLPISMVHSLPLTLHVRSHPLEWPMWCIQNSNIIMLLSTMAVHCLQLKSWLSTGTHRADSCIPPKCSRLIHNHTCLFSKPPPHTTVHCTGFHISVLCSTIPSAQSTLTSLHLLF